MSAWLALLDEPAGDLAATVVAEPWPDGRTPRLPALLVAWTAGERRPHPQARRVDPALLDPSGPPAAASLLWPARDALPLFDDPAVVAARRRARALPAPRAASTLTVDSTHFAGSLWVPGPGGRRDDDPFRLLGRPLLVSIGAGVVGTGRRLVGPAQERYAGAPWPSGRFDAG